METKRTTNLKHNGKRKRKRDADRQRALHEHTGEGEAKSEEECYATARELSGSVLTKLGAQAGELANVAAAVVGITGETLGVERTKRYPMKRGFHGTGAKRDVENGHDPIVAARTMNSITCRRLECAFLKVLSEFVPILNTNNGGGGPLGIKRRGAGAKDHQGKQVYDSDPLGYRVYVVYKLRSEGY